MRRQKRIIISGIEANLLLFALDKLLKTDREGKVTQIWPDYNRQECQQLRDRLFANHEHP